MLTSADPGGCQLATSGPVDRLTVSVAQQCVLVLFRQHIGASRRKEARLKQRLNTAVRHHAMLHSHGVYIAPSRPLESLGTLLTYPMIEPWPYLPDLAYPYSSPCI
eukprot:260038-Amphidinium_carterae.1